MICKSKALEHFTLCKVVMDPLCTRGKEEKIAQRYLNFWVEMYILHRKKKKPIFHIIPTHVNFLKDGLDSLYIQYLHDLVSSASEKYFIRLMEVEFVGFTSL